MPILRVMAIVLLAAAGSLAGGGTAGAQETVISLQPESSAVSAYRGHVVWSRPSGRRFELMLWHAGAARRLPVPTRRVQFDADIGPGPNGGLVILYSRCRREAPEHDPFTRLPLYEQGRRCALYRHRVGARGEHRLRRLSAPFGSEVLPAVWRDRVAFVRRGRVVRARANGTAAVRLPPGRASSGGELPPGPRALDIRGARVAYEWHAMLYRCPGEPATDFPGDFSQVIVASRARRRRVLATACDTDRPSSAESPSLGRASVSYVLRGRPGAVLRTRGREPAVRPIDPQTVSVQRDGGTVFWSAEQSDGPASERYKVAAEPLG
jgi:hypothetical protein